jgi:hypothetical protein
MSCSNPDYVLELPAPGSLAQTASVGGSPVALMAEGKVGTGGGVLPRPMLGPAIDATVNRRSPTPQLGALAASGRLPAATAVGSRPQPQLLSEVHTIDGIVYV